MSNCCNSKEIESYLESLNLNENVSPEMYREGIEGAMRDRARVLYFVRQVLNEKYPEIDIDDVMSEACFRFGRYKGEKFGDCKNAGEVMKKFSSKGGVLVFNQDLTSLNDEKAEKIFHYCPHVAAFKELGCSDIEIEKLCKNMLMYADYGVMDPHPVKMEFKKVISAGDDVCHLVLKTKKDE